MKKKEEVVEEQPKKKSNKKIIIAVIILAVVLFILSIALPIMFVVGAAFLFSGEEEFEQVNTHMVKVPAYDLTIDVVDEKYDKEEKCYILSAVVEKNKEKKVANLFKEGILSVDYVFKNHDGYILGTSSLDVDDIDLDGKWKSTVYFCEENARDVENYEVTDVTIY